MGVPVRITEDLYYYDGPLLVRGYFTDDPRRHVLMVAIDDDLNALAVELTFEKMLDVIHDRIDLRSVFSHGQRYYGLIDCEGGETNMLAYDGEVPDEHLPGNVTLHR